jgi:hypothetical protein
LNRYGIFAVIAAGAPTKVAPDEAKVAVATVAETRNVISRPSMAAAAAGHVTVIDAADVVRKT